MRDGWKEETWTMEQSFAGVEQRISMRNTRKLGEAFHWAVGKLNCQEWKYTFCAFVGRGQGNGTGRLALL